MQAKQPDPVENWEHEKARVEDIVHRATQRIRESRQLVTNARADMERIEREHPQMRAELQRLWHELPR